MTEKHEILNREDIKNLFRTDIGHIDDKSIRRNTEVKNIIMTGAEALIQQGHKKGKVEGLEQGKAEGLEQGKAEGLEQGRIDEKRTAVLKLVRHKFADFSDIVLNQISGIDDLVHLDDLFDQALTAESFDDIDFSKNGK